MNNIENNKLIVEFEDYKTVHNFVYPNEPLKKWIDETNFINLFKEDWNELMPSVKKIDSYANEQMCFSDFDDYRNNWKMINNPSKYNISDVYEQVVQFVKWYNSAKENTTDQLSNRDLGQSTII